MRIKSRKLRFVPVFFRMSAIVVLILVSSVGELIYGQTDISVVRSLINWSCVKDEPFLRDDKGQAVWFDSDTLQKFVIKQTSIRPPGSLGKNNLYGKVTLQLLIGKNGRPHCVRGIEGHPMAISAAAEAVSKWIFKPYKIKGKTVPILGWVTIEYDFRK